MARMRMAGVVLGTVLMVSACGGSNPETSGSQTDSTEQSEETVTEPTRSPADRSPADYIELLPKVEEMPFDGMSLEDETWIGEDHYEPDQGSSSDGLMGCMTDIAEPVAELSYSTASREYEGEADDGFVTRMVSVAVTSVPDGDSAGVVESVASKSDRCAEYVDPNQSEFSQADYFEVAEGPNAVGSGTCATMTTEFQNGIGSQPAAIQTCVTESSGVVLTVLLMEVHFRDKVEGDALDDFKARGAEMVDVAVEKAGLSA